MRTVLLALHLCGVAAWLGANFTQLFLVRFYARQPDDARRAWVRATTLMGRSYYNAAGALIGVTGVSLVIHGHWPWSSGFVWVGIAVLVVGGAMGGIGFVPSSSKLADAIAGGDRPTVVRLDRRILVLALVDTTFVLMAVLAMVDKWGR
ncbi:MAG: hypothetical protein U0Q03_00725 [Acidimicrobiales bacterium]